MIPENQVILNYIMRHTGIWISAGMKELRPASESVNGALRLGRRSEASAVVYVTLGDLALARGTAEVGFACEVEIIDVAGQLDKLVIDLSPEEFYDVHRGRAAESA
jgi:hypothetical protein